jgi:hypothetical protein
VGQSGLKKNGLLRSRALTQLLPMNADRLESDVIFKNAEDVIGHAHYVALLGHEQFQLLTHIFSDVRLNLRSPFGPGHGQE